MKTPFFSPRWRVVLVLAMAALGAAITPAARGGTQLNESISSVEAVTGDALVRAGSSRLGIVGSAEARFARPAGSGLTTRTGFYRVGFSLLTRAGNPASAVALGEAPGESVVYTEVAQVQVGPLTQQPVVRRFGQSLVPTVPLDPDRTYYVAAVLEEVVEVPGGKPPVQYVPVAGAQDGGQVYWDFTNTDPDDASLNVKGKLAPLAAPAAANLVAIRSVEGKEGFRFAVSGEFRRYDDFDETTPDDEARLAVTVRPTLRDTTTGNVIALHDDGAALTELALATFARTGGAKAPAVAALAVDLHLIPQDPAAVHPLHTFSLSVTAEYSDPEAGVVAVGAVSRSGLRLVSLSGKLFFGGVETAVTAVSGNPATTTTPRFTLPDGSPQEDADQVLALTLPAGGAYPVEAPTRTFGGGPLTVWFDAVAGPTLGDLEVAAGEVAVAGEDRGAINHVRFKRGPLVLNADGARARDFTVYLPAGFGYAADAETGLLEGRIDVAELPLDTRLEPVGHGIKNVWLNHERLPQRFFAKELHWDAAGGVFVARGVTGVEYVREKELAFLEQMSAARVDLNRRVLQPRPRYNDVTTPDPSRPEPGTRPSNEGYLRTLTLRAPVEEDHDLVVRTNAEGRALLDVEARLGKGEVVAHFPRETWTAFNSGTLSLRGSRVVTEASALYSQEPAVFWYSTIATDAPACVQGDTDRKVVFHADQEAGPEGARWQITPDGGWRTEGTVEPTDVAWGKNGAGQYMHTLVGVSGNAAAHAPGHALPAEAVAGVEPDEEAGYLAGVLLLTGYGSPDDAALLERPGTEAYDPGLAETPAAAARAGRADYAGLNLRARLNGGLRGRSVIAGETISGVGGSYRLRGYSKYYLRPGGVSGIHDPMNADILPLPKFYGYEVELANLRLTYLDNTNQGTDVTGEIDLPYPSNFKVAFEQLQISSTGELLGADLSEPGEKMLEYWGLGFRPETFEFQPNNGCEPGRALLTLGVTATMPAITPDPLYALLGFKPDGALVAAGDPEAEGLAVDSRFTLPSQIVLTGNGVGDARGRYPLTVATKATLSRFVVGGDNPETGFVSFAGTLGVPFFEDIKVHVHASPSSFADGVNTPVYLMGGWPNHTSRPDLGWTEGGKNFFNDATFDAENRGYPASLPGVGNYNSLSAQGKLDNYRNFRESFPNGELTPRFHPVVRKVWPGVVTLNYSVQWDPLRRVFEGFDNPSARFLIISAEHELQSLTTQGCEISIGAELKTPRLTVSALTAQALELTGASDLIAKAMVGVIDDVPGMVEALDGLEKLVADRLGRLVDEALNAGLTGVADTVYQNLEAHYVIEPTPQNPDGAPVPGRIKQIPVGHLGSGVSWPQVIGGLIAEDNSPLPAELRKSLEAARKVCDVGITLVESREKITRAVQQIGQYGERIGLGVAPATNAISAQIVESESTLVECAAGLKQLKETIDELLEQVGPDGSVGRALKTAFMAATNDAGVDAMRGLERYFQEQSDPTGRYLSEVSQARVKAEIKRVLRQRLTGGALAKEAQPVLRARFSAIRERCRAGIDLAFGEINRILNRAVDGVLEQTEYTALSDKTDESPPGDPRSAGGVGNFFAAARMDGYVQTDGEKIAEVRINASLRLQVSDALVVDGWFRLLNTDSDTPNTTCRDPGDVDTEVTVGAHAKATFGVIPVEVTMEGKFSFKDGGLSGLDGSFDLRTKLPIRQASLDRVALKFGFGGGEAYISGLVGASIDLVEMEGYCFFGATKNPQAFNLIDKETRRVLNQTDAMEGNSEPLEIPGTGISLAMNCLNKPLIGFYTGFEGNISVNEFFRIPDSCFLSLKAIVGGGNFLFFSGKDGGGINLTAGVRYSLGVNGKIGCIVDVTGQLGLAVAVTVGIDDLSDLIKPGAIFNSLTNAEAVGAASLTVSGSIGPCPLCVKGSYTVWLDVRLSKDGGVKVGLSGGED